MKKEKEKIETKKNVTKMIFINNVEYTFNFHIEKDTIIADSIIDSSGKNVTDIVDYKGHVGVFQRIHDAAKAQTAETENKKK